MATTNKNSTASLSELEKTLNMYFVEKAPFALPKGLKDFIVQWGPWITLVMLILALPAILVALGLTAVLAPFGMMGGYGYGYHTGGVYWVAAVLGLISLIMEAMAIPGLMARRKAGWNMMFYASIVSIVASIIELNIGGALISAVVGWYFIFQVRSYYK